MEGRTPEFDQTVSGSHTAISALRIIGVDDQILEELRFSDASTRADKTASGMRELEATIPDPYGTYAPESMASPLGPASRLQMLRGVRKQRINKIGMLLNTADAWTVTTPEGVSNGVQPDPVTGQLILGGP